MKIGALEAGGTKMVMGVFTQDGTLLKEESLPTLQPQETIPHLRSLFASEGIDALGIAGFGPIDLHRESPTYGWITSTPKLAWQNYPLLPNLVEGMSIPSAIDTDVNAAVLAELKTGAAQGLENVVYVTVGTGIGGGISVGGRLVHGLLHPELGHMLLRPHPQDPNAGGVCPFHGCCLEGLASGPAICARVQGDASALPDDDLTFDIEANYLAQMCVNLSLTVSPERIILGGGVMQRVCLFDKVRQETLRLLNGYIQHPSILEKIDEYIVPPKLFPISGLVGAYLLGLDALQGKC